MTTVHEPSQLAVPGACSRDCSDALTGGYDDARVVLLRQVLLVSMVMLLCLAAVNAIVITAATALDNRHASALARLRRNPS